MKKCALCNKYQKPGSGTFFGVPQDDRRAKWKKICGLEFSKNAVVCMDHFTASSYVKTGQKCLLLPHAVPIIRSGNTQSLDVELPLQNNNSLKISNYCSTHTVHDISVTTTSTEALCISDQFTTQVSKYCENESQTEKHVPEIKNTFLESHDRLSTKNVSISNINIIPPQLDEPIVQMPTAKSVASSECTQTNIRFCGLVETSDVSDEFRFSCFYCVQVFPLDKWKDFVNHLKDSHFSEEEAFQTSKYLSKEHDYTPISMPNKTVKYSSEPEFSSIVDPLHKTFESVIFNSSLHISPRKKKLRKKFVTHRSRQQLKKSKTKYKITTKQMPLSSTKFSTNLSKQQTSKISVLNRCFKRTVDEPIVAPVVEKESLETKSLTVDPENPTEISFEYSPSAIVDLLLDNMRLYPVLWHFDENPFNIDFFEAVENLCTVINNQYSLYIDNLKMRRSINRILRFYCNVFPNESNHKFTCYYNKCAKFLPPVKEIAYARCSHCYICFESDYDLKFHLEEEQKYLEWPYKCTQCRECFSLWNEFQFHKDLPHYDEIFRCQSCKLSFFRRLAYKKHMVEEHESINKPGIFKCDICDRSLETLKGLKAHKKIHGERQHKCNLCSKAFLEKSKLELHLKVHRQEYDFICEFCGKKIKTERWLKDHITKHTGEKVTCKICDLRLRKSSLGRHLRIVHGENATPLKPALQSFFNNGKQICLRRLVKEKRKRYPLKSKKRNEIKYKCKICKINCDSRKQIVEHNKQMHADKWPCKICTSEYTSKLSLKSHYRTKHKLHTLQIYKLVVENAELDVVLAIKNEIIEEICNSVKFPKKSPTTTANSDNEPTINTETKSDSESLIKAELLSGEIFFPEEKLYSSAIQDEIIKADIERQDDKIDYIDDMLTAFLK